MFWKKDPMKELGQKADANLSFIAKFVDEISKTDENATTIMSEVKERKKDLEIINTKAVKAKNFSAKLLKILVE